jgi:hypothetical protein
VGDDSRLGNQSDAIRFLGKRARGRAVRTLIGGDRDPMRAMVIAVMDQQAVNARGAHFGVVGELPSVSLGIFAFFLNDINWTVCDG